MESPLSQLLWNVTKSHITKAITFVAGVLVAKGVIEEGQSSALVSGFVEIAMGVAVFLVSSGITIYQRYKDQIKLMIAARLPAGSSLETIDAAAKTNTTPLKLMALLLVVGIGASAVGAAGCGKRYAPGTTVTQAMAYELDEGLKPLVATQGKVIAAVDAVCLPVGAPANPEQCKVLKPNADKFLKVVDQLMALVEKEVSPRLKQLDAAIYALDAVRQGQLRAELVPFLGELSALTAKAFGTALPDGLVAKATTLAGKSIETFFQLRDAITELVNKIRGDAVGSMPSVPPTAAQAF
jgi:hypothetical protein